ncbi:hypothetical protein C1646_687670 [Rhizophagus diaphanus]|nr:hypothetical protein C1646_687670 [Rhizophagus diaphanus] [Rhizophagus sp. MUCL 43196]
MYYDKNLKKMAIYFKMDITSYTPPYHCELQPIEGVGSTVKGVVARTSPILIFSLLETNYCMLLRKRLPLKL